MMGHARNGDRRTVGYLVAAAAVIAIVAGLVLAFGVVRPPSLVAVADSNPEVPGGVAFVQWDERGSCPSLHVVLPDGVQRTGTCDSSLGQVVGWTSRGIVVVVWVSTGEVLRIYDPASLEVIASGASSGDAQQDMSDLITTERSADGILTVYTGGSHTALWSVRAPARYDVTGGSRSPDGRWYALVDSFGRLLLVPADGSRAPLVWAAGLSQGLWPGPVWEGSPVTYATVKDS